MEAAGHHVALALPIYRFEDPGNLLTIDTRSLLSILREGTGKSIPLDQVDPEQVAGRGLIRSFAARRDLPVIDIGRYHRTADRCGLWYQGVPVYQDHSHVSAQFNALLGPAFAAVMAPVEGSGSS